MFDKNGNRGLDSLFLRGTLKESYDYYTRVVNTNVLVTEGISGNAIVYARVRMITETTKTRIQHARISATLLLSHSSVRARAQPRWNVESSFFRHLRRLRFLIEFLLSWRLKRLHIKRCKKKNYAKMGKHVRDRRRSRRIINVRAIAVSIDDYNRRRYNYLQECNVT